MFLLNLAIFKHFSFFPICQCNYSMPNCGFLLALILLGFLWVWGYIGLFFWSVLQNLSYLFSLPGILLTFYISFNTVWKSQMLHNSLIFLVLIISTDLSSNSWFSSIVFSLLLDHQRNSYLQYIFHSIFLRWGAFIYLCWNYPPVKY